MKTQNATEVLSVQSLTRREFLRLGSGLAAATAIPPAARALKEGHPGSHDWRFHR